MNNKEKEKMNKIIDILNKYNSLEGKYNELNNNSPRISELAKYDSLKNKVEIIFSGNYDILINQLCTLHKYTISKREGYLLFRGQLVNDIITDYEKCFDDVNICFNSINTLLQGIVKKNGDVENQIKELCRNYNFIRTVYCQIESYKEIVLKDINKEKENKQKELKLELDEYVNKYPFINNKNELEKLFQFESVNSDCLYKLFDDKYIKSNKISLGKFNEYLENDNYKVLRRFGVQVKELCELNLKPCEGNNTLFVEVFDTFRKKNYGDDYYNLVYTWIVSALSDFNPNNIRFAFIENDKQVLDPISKLLTDISPNLMYDTIASTKDDTNKLLYLINEEKKERLSTLRSMYCTSIEEYNLKNARNPMDYICLVINGYPDLIADNYSLNNLKEIIENSARAGMFVIVLGQNRSDNRNIDNILDLDYLKMNKLDVDASGVIRYKDTILSIRELNVDVNNLIELNNKIKTKLKEIISDSDKFYINSIFERNSKTPIETLFSVPLGDCDGNTYYLESNSKSLTSFTLVTGKSGSGKSAFLHSFIMSSAMKYSPEEYEIYITDFKTETTGNEFKDYEKKGGIENCYIPHVKYLSLKSSPENALSLIDYILNLMSEKSKIGKFDLYNSSEDVRLGKKKRMPFSLFIIDEYETLFNSINQSRSDDLDIFITSKIKAGLATIVKKARTAGIGIIFSGQGIKNVPDDVINQISNRISFYQDSSELYRRLYNKWQDKMFRNFPVKDYEGYALCASNANNDIEFVKMAYAGSTESAMMRGYAKEIREKYPNSNNKQVIIGTSSSAHISDDNKYLTWEEEINNRIYKYKLEYENEEDFEKGKQREACLKDKPLAIGVSESSGLPVNLEYTMNPNSTNYYACANESLIYRLEQNSIIAFAYQMLMCGKINKSIVYCGGEEDYTNCLGEIIKDVPYVNHFIKHISDKKEIINFIIDTNMKKTISPQLIVIHNPLWLNKDEIRRLLDEDNLANKSLHNDETFKDQTIDILTNSGISDEELESLKGVIQSSNPNGLDFLSRKVSNSDFKAALNNLYINGNEEGKLMLFTGIKPEILKEALFNNLSGSVENNNCIYATYNDLKQKKVDDNASANTCYVMPSATNVKLYDYTYRNSKSWWDAFIKMYNNIK